MRHAVDVVFKTTRSYTGTGQDYLLEPGTSWEKGEPVLYFDSLKATTTEGEAETVYAQGGAGNPRIIAWEGDKTVTFTFEDALISVEGMSILAGADLMKADAENLMRVHQKAVVQAGAEGRVELDVADLVEDEIFGFLVDGSGEIIKRLGQAEYDNTEKTLTFNKDRHLVIESDIIMLDYYIAKDTGVQEVSIAADKFAGYFYIEGSTLFRRQSDGRDLAAQMIIPNAKIQTAFEFSMSPEGDPSTFTFTADAFPGKLAGAGLNDGDKMYALRIMDN